METGSSSAILELQRAALQYMDDTGILDNVRQTCKAYSSIQDKTFHFTIPVQPSDLLELNAELGNFVLNHSTAACKIFQEVMYVAIESLCLLPQCSAQGQVVVVLRLLALPSLPSYVLTSARQLTRHVKSKQFLQYEGVVCGMSILHKYTQVARFQCPVEVCSGHDGDKFIRIHIPGAREAQTIRRDFTCTYCGSPLVEDISCRVLADRLIVELVDEDAFRCKTAATARFQTLVAYFRDSLTNGIEIGQKLKVIGLPVWDLDQDSLALEVNSVSRCTACIQPVSSAAPSLCTLPDSIASLYTDREKSPWSFGLSLAYAFAEGITPVGSFLQLKLALLLSLVTTLNKDIGALDLLAVGSDSVVLHRLLRYAAGFRRAVTHTAQNCLTASVSKDKHSTGTCFIQGGSLLLAHDGVCLIPNLGSAKKTMHQTLLQALETGSIHVDVPQRVSHQSSHQLFLPRRCCVWSFTDPVSQRKPQNFDDLSQHVEIGSREIESLADVFGLVCFTDCDMDSYADQLTMDHVLSSAMGITHKPLIGHHDFQQFLNLAGHLEVQFTPAAEVLIRKFYVGSRRVRSSGDSPNTLPVTAVNTITSLASAHARLNLRSEVREEDAVMAIYLYEESVTCRYGHSVLNVQPLLHIKDDNIQHYIGLERDVQLHEFHQNLQHFVAAYATDLEE